MVNTGLIKILSEIDTNIFLFFNGIHSPFWDYFMTSFTGKIIWVPMLRYHPVYPTKELSLESSPVLCNSYRTYHHLCRPSVQQPYPPGCSPSASRQSRKSDCRYGIYRKRLPRRKLRIPLLSCCKFIRTSLVCGIHIPQTLAKSFHHSVGCP